MLHLQQKIDLALNPAELTGDVYPSSHFGSLAWPGGHVNSRVGPQNGAVQRSDNSNYLQMTGGICAGASVHGLLIRPTNIPPYGPPPKSDIFTTLFWGDSVALSSVYCLR